MWNEHTYYSINKPSDLKTAAISSVDGWSLCLPYLNRQKAALLCEAESEEETSRLTAFSSAVGLPSDSLRFSFAIGKMGLTAILFSWGESKEEKGSLEISFFGKVR